jgi:alpha-galactosidase/6-phospho-beta-glucosidase family protein
VVGADPDWDLAAPGELPAPLIEGVLCGIDTSLVAINVPNAGYVPGLPEGAVIDLPARADASGLHPPPWRRSRRESSGC